MLRTCTVIVTALLVVGAARASPYWIDYEGSSGQFPEQQAWTRFTGYGGDQRSFDNGWLVMDGTADPRIYDYVDRFMNGSLNPGPGETFVAQWRIRVDQIKYYDDPGVGIFSDDKWAVGLTLSRTTIRSVFEDGVSATFEADVPHDFELTSSDMRAYVLSIDAVPEIYGNFWLSLTASKVGWGDFVYGDASLARWERFSFGVVPECSSFLLTTFVSAFLILLRTRAVR